MAIWEVLSWNLQLWAQQWFCRRAAFMLFRCGQHRAPICQALCLSTKKHECYQTTCLHSAWRLMAEGDTQRRWRNSRQRTCAAQTGRQRVPKHPGGGCDWHRAPERQALGSGLSSLQLSPLTALPTYQPNVGRVLVMSDSLWLLCPWDSPGKNTGARCHFFLQGILPGPETEPLTPVSPALQLDSLPAAPLGRS